MKSSHLSPHDEPLACSHSLGMYSSGSNGSSSGVSGYLSVVPVGRSSSLPGGSESVLSIAMSGIFFVFLSLFLLDKPDLVFERCGFGGLAEEPTAPAAGCSWPAAFYAELLLELAILFKQK